MFESVNLDITITIDVAMIAAVVVVMFIGLKNGLLKRHVSAPRPGRQSKELKKIEKKSAAVSTEIIDAEMENSSDQ